MSLDIKRGDTWPPMVLRITEKKPDGDGRLVDEPVPLTAASEVRVIIKADGAIGGVVLGPATISDAENGEVTYEWQPGDTDTAGVYKAETEIVWQAGGVQTVPNAGYEEVRINEDLGGVAPAA